MGSYSAGRRTQWKAGQEESDVNKVKNTFMGTIALSLADIVNSRKKSATSRVTIHPHRVPSVHKALSVNMVVRPEGTVELSQAYAQQSLC